MSEEGVLLWSLLRGTPGLVRHGADGTPIGFDLGLTLELGREIGLSTGAVMTLLPAADAGLLYGP